MLRELIKERRRGSDFMSLLMRSQIDDNQGDIRDTWLSHLLGLNGSDESGLNGLVYGFNGYS